MKNLKPKVKIVSKQGDGMLLSDEKIMAIGEYPLLWVS